MFIHRFEVQGFKNFVEPVVLDELGEINVIHGDNNVGKSNLLEAMHLFFAIANEWALPSDSKPFGIGAQELVQMDHPQQSIFGLQSADPIIFDVLVAIDPDVVPIKLWEGSTIIREMRVKLILERGLNGVRVSCPSLTFDGEVIDDSRERERALARRLFDILGGQKLLYAAREVPRFSLIDERRGRKTILKASPEAIVPQDLELTLFDAMTSAEPLLYSRWALLADMIIEAMPGLSPGRFVAAYDRVASAATLFYESSKGRLPIRQMGSSVQQIAALLGHALMSGASLIAIEEPESNLKYPLQVRLRDVFRKLVAHPYGPRQLFITSHSPAFETGDHFYAMTLDNGIPRLTRRPVAEAPAFTGLDNLPVPPSGEGRRSYVTSDGLVEVPPFVLDALGLPQGGGVFFAVRKDDGHVEMLSHRQFLELGGYPTDDDTDD